MSTRRLRPDGRRRFRAWDHRRCHAERLRPAGRGRRRLPQRHGGDARQFDADRRRILRQEADRLRHQPPTATCRTAASGPTSATACPDGICLDARRRRLVRRRPQQALRARSRRRRNLADDRARPRLLRLHARGRRQENAVLVATEWRGPAGMTDGRRTGQVLTVKAPAPGVGWP